MQVLAFYCQVKLMCPMRYVLVSLCLSHSCVTSFMNVPDTILNVVLTGLLLFAGNKWADDKPREELDPDSVNVMSFGACGAFVHGLEDEFMAVR